MTFMDYGPHVAKLLFAIVLGGVVGIERQWRRQLAGVRTNALVAMGAATFTLFAAVLPNPGVDSVARVAAQVVSGIGFLGAGVIMRDGLTVHGLTTAATLWCSAAVGVLCGAGLVDLAMISAGFILVVNLALRPISKAIDAKQGRMVGEIQVVTVTCLEKAAKDIRRNLQGFVEESHTELLALAVSTSDDASHTYVTAKIRGLDKADPQNIRLFRQLDSIDGVISVKIE